jgi:hypothetical protein
MLFYVLIWAGLSLPIGVFVGKIFAEMDRTPSRRHRNNLNKASRPERLGRNGENLRNGKMPDLIPGGTIGGRKRLQSVGEGDLLMADDQIAALDDHQLAMHISRVQQLSHADRELSELLDERRRRQIVAAIGDTADEDEFFAPLLVASARQT